MQRWNRPLASTIIPIVALVLGTFAQFLPTTADAAAFTQAYLRLDRMKSTTPTGGTVCAKPVTVATEGLVVITFPSTYTASTTAANWTVTTTNLPATSTAWLG